MMESDIFNRYKYMETLKLTVMFTSESVQLSISDQIFTFFCVGRSQKQYIKLERVYETKDRRILVLGSHPFLLIREHFPCLETRSAANQIFIPTCCP